MFPYTIYDIMFVVGVYAIICLFTLAIDWLRRL